MNEIQISNFDYSLVDQSTAEYLESKSYKIHGIADNMRTKIGKELKEVQNKLANNYQGVFAKWYESMGLNKNTVYYWINIYEFSTNLEDTNQLENFTNAPKSLQKETMKKKVPKELKEKVLSGDIKTNKEFKELERQLKQEQQARKQAEKDNRKLGQLLVEEQNKEPRVIEKEVVPDHIKEQLQEKDRFLKATKREYESLQDELKILKAQHSDDSKDQLSEQKLKRLEREASIETMELAVNIRRFLKDASLTQYQIGALANASESYKNKTLENVEILETFVKNIKSALNGRIEI